MPNRHPIQKRCAGTLAGHDGFSLVELMVAVFLIIITVPIFVGLQLNAVKLNNRAAELDQSIWGAQAKMEELWLEDVKDVKNGSDTMTLPDGRTLTRSWDVQNNKPMVGLKTVTVEVVSDWIEEAEIASLQFVMSDRMKGGSSGPGGSGKSKSGKSKSGKSKSGKSKDDKSENNDDSKEKSGKSKEKSGKSGSGKSGSGESGSGESGSGKSGD